MMTGRARGVVRIMLVAALLILVVVCAAHVGVRHHDGDSHPLALAIVVFSALVLWVQAGPLRRDPLLDRCPGRLMAIAFPLSAIDPGAPRPLRC